MTLPSDVPLAEYKGTTFLHTGLAYMAMVGHHSSSLTILSHYGRYSRFPKSTQPRSVVEGIVDAYLIQKALDGAS